MLPSKCLNTYRRRPGFLQLGRDIDQVPSELVKREAFLVVVPELHGHDWLIFRLGIVDALEKRCPSSAGLPGYRRRAADASVLTLRGVFEVGKEAVAPAAPHGDGRVTDEKEVRRLLRLGDGVAGDDIRREGEEEGDGGVFHDGLDIV